MDKKSKLGYKKNSPYKNKESLLINSNVITTEDMAFPIIAMGNGGESSMLYPNTGEFIFPNSTKVIEINPNFSNMKTNKKYGGGGKVNEYEILSNYLPTLSPEEQDQFIDMYENSTPDNKMNILMKCGGMMKYQQGGLVKGQKVPEEYANAEVEGGETVLTPDGMLMKFNGPSHAQGGINTNLEEGTKIFSEHLKVPEEVQRGLGLKKVNKKLSYAKLSEKLNTKPFIEMMNETDDPYKLNAAKVQLEKNMAMLESLFFAQEKDKEMKGMNAPQYTNGERVFAQTGTQMGEERYDLSSISSRFKMNPNGTVTDPMQGEIYRRNSDGTYSPVTYDVTASRAFPIDNSGSQSGSFAPGTTRDTAQSRVQLVRPNRPDPIGQGPYPVDRFPIQDPSQRSGSFAPSPSYIPNGNVILPSYTLPPYEEEEFSFVTGSTVTPRTSFIGRPPAMPPAGSTSTVVFGPNNEVASSNVVPPPVIPGVAPRPQTTGGRRTTSTSGGGGGKGTGRPTPQQVQMWTDEYYDFAANNPNLVLPSPTSYNINTAGRNVLIDYDIPSKQGKLSGKKVYGEQDWTSQDLMADFKARFPDFIAQNPNWDPTKEKQTAAFQTWHNDMAKKYGMPIYFTGDRGFSGIDDKFGQYTWSAPSFQNQQEVLPGPVQNTPAYAPTSPTAPLAQLPQRPINAMSFAGPQPTAPSVIQQVVQPREREKFGINQKLLGTLADIGLVMSDRLNIDNPTIYNRQKNPMFNRFYEFDNREAQRMADRQIQGIMNSNLPEQVKQAQIAAVTSQMQDQQGRVDFANAQRYEQKREMDLNKLQQYVDANLESRINEFDIYRQKMARVKDLQNQFKANRKQQIVNSAKDYWEYTNKLNTLNELNPYFELSPITGRTRYKPQPKSELDSLQQKLNQYSRNPQAVDVGGGTKVADMGDFLVVTSPTGEVKIVEKNKSSQSNTPTKEQMMQMYLNK